MWAYERIKEVEKDSWTCGGTKKRHGEPEQLLSTGGATWRLRATAERRGVRGNEQWGGAEAVVELPGNAWSGARVGAGLGRRGNGGHRWRCYGCREKQRKEKGEGRS
jgi:hypothetical protein